MKKGFDYIGVTCCFYCYDSKGKFLLNKRSEKCRDEVGRWDCGGGAIKFGESWTDAARREIKEEYRAKILEIKQVGVNNVIRNHNGRKTHWIAIVFAVKVDPKTVIIGDKDKIAAIGWFKPEKWPKPFHSMFLTHFEFVKKAGVE